MDEKRRAMFKKKKSLNGMDEWYNIIFTLF